ncbi:hypothetical protein [Kushneria konosiri]|uniref:Uncharacterized protein n=1 Tax=Kushneria konosiri TaxID=698828 RepID=A0A2Z2HDC1_9GAMM|nr:hypothetical protein [Kushneria konosiri]ARS53510.1 hypothetical protein B9G99_12125 [Kushneria konosiri]
MAWSDVGRRLEREAPELAALFRNPENCEALGAIVAATLECWANASAQGVSDMLDQNPDAINRLKQLDVERIKLQLEAAAIKPAMSRATGSAIKGLFNNDWRAGVGWTLCGMLALMSLAVCITVVRDPDRIQDCVDIMTWLIFSASGILGINLHGNSVERRVMMEETHMGMNDRGSEAMPPPRPRDIQD